MADGDSIFLKLSYPSRRVRQKRVADVFLINTSLKWLFQKESLKRDTSEPPQDSRSRTFYKEKVFNEPIHTSASTILAI